MKISWQGVVALAIAVTGAVVAALLDHNELALSLGGLAIGLSTKLGAIGGSGGGALAVFLAVGLGLGAVSSGCAGTQVREERLSKAEFALALASNTYEQVAGAVVMPWYASQGDECRENDTQEAYDNCMERPNAVVTGLSAGFGALEQARFGLRARRGKEEAIACLRFSIEALDNTLVGLSETGVDVPEAVLRASSTLRFFVPYLSEGSQCPLR